MKALGIIAALLLLVSASATALLIQPVVESAAVEKDNPDVVYLRIVIQEPLFAISTNAGASFRTASLTGFPPTTTTDLAFHPRHYALVESLLLRSEDGGRTWTNTAAKEFLRAQAREIEQTCKRRFQEHYGARLPERSALWHPVFGGFAALYGACVLFFVTRSRGWLVSTCAVVKGAIVLGLAWCVLVGFHTFMMWHADSQWPTRVWNTHAEFNPGFKTAIGMAVAARPLPLLCYLAILWWVLPGSMEALAAIRPRQKPSISLFYRALAIGAGIVFIGGHLMMLVWGSFQD